jgi:hypothetical protein
MRLANSRLIWHTAASLSANWATARSGNEHGSAILVGILMYAVPDSDTCFPTQMDDETVRRAWPKTRCEHGL